MSRLQLSLDLDFNLGEAVPINTLAPGERFVRDGTEGQVIRVTDGSATVKVLKNDQKWEKIQWSPATKVRKLNA